MIKNSLQMYIIYLEK